MHTEPMNQEIARLHRAETLRMSRRHVHVEQDAPAAAPVADGLLLRIRAFAWRPSWHPPTLRAH